MNNSVLKPGTYKISDLATRLKVHRTSVERYIQKLELELTEIESKGRPVKAVVLANHAQADRLLSYVHENKGMNDGHLSNDTDMHVQQGSMSEQCVSTSKSHGVITFEAYQELQEKLLESEVSRAKLEGELNGLKQANEALTRTVDALENTIKATLLLEGKRSESIHYLPSNQNQVGFLGRLKQLFFGTSKPL